MRRSVKALPDPASAAGREAEIGEDGRPAGPSALDQSVSASPASIEVAPLTMNSAGNDTMARKPPAAGPTLIPRLIARRATAKAALRCDGPATSEYIDRFAGRNASLVKAQTIVRPRIEAWLRPRG